MSKFKSFKVYVLSTSYPRYAGDDAGIFVKRLVDAFAGAGLKGEVFVPSDKKDKDFLSDTPFPIRRYRYGIFSRGRLAFGAGIIPNLRESPWLILQAPMLLLSFVFPLLKARFFKKERAIVQANWLSSGLSAWLINRLCGVPYILTIRGEDVRFLKKPFYRKLFRATLKRAAYITSVNNTFLTELSEHFDIPEERLRCIPNGVDAKPVTADEFNAFIKESPFSADKNYLLFVGTVIPRKRVKLLLELLTQPALKDYELVVCGRTNNQPYLAELNEYIAAHNLSKRVHLMGLIPPAMIPLYMRLASFYISASEFEGRPNSVLEAMANNLPVIVSDIEAHRELVVHKESGVLFNPDNLDEVAGEIKRLEHSPEQVAKLKEKAKEVVEPYTWEHAASLYNELFDSMSRGYASYTKNKKTG